MLPTKRSVLNYMGSLNIEEFVVAVSLMYVYKRLLRARHNMLTWYLFVLVRSVVAAVSVGSADPVGPVAARASSKAPVMSWSHPRALAAAPPLSQNHPLPHPRHDAPTGRSSSTTVTPALLRAVAPPWWCVSLTYGIPLCECFQYVWQTFHITYVLRKLLKGFGNSTEICLTLYYSGIFHHV